MKYKAFISYKHDEYSRPFAESIEDAIKVYGKPLFQRPPPIFRDEKILPPGGNLPAAIRQGLADSDYLIYLASRNAAAAPWIRDELDTWLGTLKRADHFIIVVIEDKVSLKGEGKTEVIDWERTEILPPILRQYDLSNPVLVDLSWARKDTDRDLENPRFRREINAIAAKLHNIEPGEMVDKAILQYKKNRRLRNSAIASLLTLFFAAATLAVVSYVQRQQAIRNKSSALSFLSQSILPTDPTRAFLVAEEALKVNQDNTDAASALRSAWYSQPFYFSCQANASSTYQVAWSPSGKHFATISEGRIADLWTSAASHIKQIIDSTGLILRFAWSHDGRRFVTGDNHGMISIYDSTGAAIGSRWHNDQIGSLQFSPDDRDLLSASRDCTARIWDLAHNSSVVIPHSQRVYTACFSPDGLQVLTACEDSNAYLWDRKGVLLHRLQGHKCPIVKAIYSHRGKYILTMGFDGNVILWDSQCRYIRKFPGAEGSLTLCFSPDDRRFLFAGSNRTLSLYDLVDQRMTAVDGSTQAIASGEFSAKFSPDGRYCAFAGGDAIVHLCSAKGVRVADLTGGVQDLRMIEFSPDSRYLISSGQQGKIFIWDLANVDADVFNALDDEISVFATSPDGEKLALGYSAGDLVLLDKNKKLLYRQPLHHKSITGISFSPDGNYLATASMDNSGMLLNIRHLTDTHRLIHRDDLSSVDFSPDSKLLATAGFDSVARIWDLNGRLRAILRSQGWVYSVRFTPKDHHLITTSADGAAIIWTDSGRLIKTLSHPKRVYGVSFSPTEDKFLTWDLDSVVRIWDSNGDPLGQFNCGTDYSHFPVKFSPDGKYIAAPAGDKAVQILTADGHPLWTLSGHTDVVADCCFSADSRRIATASYDHAARLYSIDGNLLQIFKGHTASVTTVRFNAGDTELLTTSPDGSLRTWPLVPADILQRVRHNYPLSIDQLTPAERKSLGIN